MSVDPALTRVVMVLPRWHGYEVGILIDDKVHRAGHEVVTSVYGNDVIELTAAEVALLHARLPDNSWNTDLLQWAVDHGNWDLVETGPGIRQWIEEEHRRLERISKLDRAAMVVEELALVIEWPQEMLEQAFPKVYPNFDEGSRSCLIKINREISKEIKKHTSPPKELLDLWQSVGDKIPNPVRPGL
jgi:hypothetical protein